MRKLLHVAVDVDDKNFHGAGFCRKTQETIEFRCKPTNGALLHQLEKLQSKGFMLKTCYESTYIGYSLHRMLTDKGIDNEIIASSLIPTKPGRRVKTDRVDAKRLAALYAKDELTPIFIPDQEDEAARALIRSRAFVVRQRSDLKRHVLSLMRTQGCNYKQETSNKTYWTKGHVTWMLQQAENFSPLVSANINLLLEEYNSLSVRIAAYDAKIEEMSKLPRYREQVANLSCFRGIGILSAMVFVTEIGDARRFPHPRNLTSYAGLDIREHSSGGKEKKFGITKMGNANLRTTAIESCQRAGLRCVVSKRLKAARAGQSKRVVEVADRCMARLRKRYHHLLYRGKQVNKVKVACARELLSFVWEVMCLASNKCSKEQYEHVFA